MNKIVQRYIFKEMLAPFGVSIAFFSFVFIMTQLPQMTNYVVNYRIGLTSLGLMLLYSLPFFLQFILPMAVMIAVLLTFLRMSGDMEIVALKAGGVNIYRLLPPVLVFGLIGAVINAGMAVHGLPMGRKAAKQLLYDVAVAHVDIGLTPRRFIDTYKDVVLYIHEVDTAGRTLRDIFIEDRRSADMSSTVVAPRGRLSVDSENMVANLRLFDGTIHQVGLEEGRVNEVRFETYDIRLDMDRSMDGVSRRPQHVEEMTMAELRHIITGAEQKDGRYYKALLEWHKKFSLPAACPALALLGMALGVRARSSKRAYGIGLGLAFFLLYYILLSLGWALGEEGVYPPAIGMWVPNIVSAGIGWILLVRAVNETPLALPPAPAWLKRLFRRRQ
ncbi:LPS export ABC transporter permease LptF [Desulfatitalea alkaliphila]|uniref:LPS export ABC transporter permease LptF n=1 Tax=Desulfatitalea alkaliphila TaxID=2929485 RepID=A0AA41UIG1_9BACT|nr:LPS export ABC transporter permease LptF [Desulfatitalea alkaliphila]MCJ8500745.1 LPS export ABC transporter permease LptF [Desulfatitalea alkaliphila]